MRPPRVAARHRGLGRTATRSGLLMALLSLALLTGCGPRPTPTPTATPYTIETRQAIATLNRILPPTWTPAPTRTPPPTQTPLPTPTPRPTLSVEQVCTRFVLVAAPIDGIQLNYDAETQFVYSGVPRGAAAGLAIKGEGDDPELRLRIPFEGDGIVPISLSILPGPGRYHWRLWVQHPVYGEICLNQGIFVRRPPPDAAASPAPTSTAEIF